MPSKCELGSSSTAFFHIFGNRWFCHHGSFIEGHFHAENPFDVADLVEKDLLRDSWETHGKPSRRISRQPKLILRALHDAMRNHSDAWHGVVAVATSKVEELRAGTERPMDLAMAKANF